MKIKTFCFRQSILTFLLTFVLLPAQAHVGLHPSVHDTVAGIVDRMRRELSKDELLHVTVQKAEQFLTAKEREILGAEHISFRVNVPVTVTILRDAKMAEEPFWLNERGFKATGLRLKEWKLEMEAWQKDFDAGWVGLGVHSLSRIHADEEQGKPQMDTDEHR